MPDNKQELTELNKEIGKAEMERNAEFLREYLSDNLVFRRAEDDLSKRVDAILKKFEDRLGKEENSSTNTQQQPKLVARLINTLPYLERLKNARVNVGQAEVAAATLLTQHPQIELAEEIINELERRRDIYKSTFRSVWEGRSPVAQLLLGVAFHVLLLIIALVALLILTRKGLLGNFDLITVWVLGGELWEASQACLFVFTILRWSLAGVRR